MVGSLDQLEGGARPELHNRLQQAQIGELVAGALRNSEWIFVSDK